jgi:hypothetical protein
MTFNFFKKKSKITIKLIPIDEYKPLLSVVAPNDMRICLVEPDEMAQCYFNNTFDGYFGCIYKGFLYVSDKYPHKKATVNYPITK